MAGAQSPVQYFRAVTRTEKMTPMQNLVQSTRDRKIAPMQKPICRERGSEIQWQVCSISRTVTRVGERLQGTGDRVEKG